MEGGDGRGVDGSWVESASVSRWCGKGARGTLRHMLARSAMVSVAAQVVVPQAVWGRQRQVSECPELPCRCGRIHR